MKKFNCVFCRQPIYSNVDIEDASAHAICDACYCLGGRLPRSSWEVRLDCNGNPRNKKSPIWGKLTRRLKHPKAIFGVILLMIASRIFNGSFLVYLLFAVLSTYVLALLYELWNAET